MLLNQTFNAADMPKGDDVLPAGKYNAIISGAELKPTKTGGMMLVLKLTINDPQHQGRAVFDRLNIQNPNPVAEKIAKQQLGKIMSALDLAALSDTDALINGSVSITVGIREDDSYGVQNTVKAYGKPNGAAAAQVAATQTAKPVATATKAPWL